MPICGNSQRAFCDYLIARLPKRVVLQLHLDSTGPPIASDDKWLFPQVIHDSFFPIKSQLACYVGLLEIGAVGPSAQIAHINGLVAPLKS